MVGVIGVIVPAYWQGAAAAAVMAVPLVLASVRIRQRLVPTWSSAIARLAEITAGLSVLLAVLHVLGSVGLFRRWWIAAAVTVTGIAVVAFVRPEAAPLEPEDEDDTSPAPDDRLPRWIMWTAVGLGVLVLGQWLSRTLAAFDFGISEYDSTAYHLPHAARFTQTGWITELHFNRTEWPDMLHPSDSELVHALGMSLFGRDFLSPFVNVGFGLLAGLAGWCAGLRARVAPLTFLATLVVLASPSMSALQPGSAMSDVASVGLFVAAVAFLIHDHHDRGAVILAGAAAGVALGTKLTVLVPLVVLTIGLAVIVWRRRQALTLAWTAPLLITGSFWFLRNLFRTGSPLSSLKLGLGPISFPTGDFVGLERYGFSIFDYRTDGTTWSDWFLPGFDNGFGPLWWLLFLTVGAGFVLCLAQGSSLVRVFAVAGLAAIASHIVNPAGALGERGFPWFFELNLRYMYPGMVLPLLLVPTLPLMRSRRAHAIIAVLAAVLVFSAQLDDKPFFKPWAQTHRRSSLALAMLAAAAGYVLITRVWPRLMRMPRPAHVAVVALVIIGGIGAGAMAEHRYISRRYGGHEEAKWADTKHHVRIGQAGFDRGYEFYGRDLSNYVQYIGESGPHGAWHDFRFCADWRRAVNEGRYQYLVVSTNDQLPTSYQQWATSDPGAKLVAKLRQSAVFEVVQPLDPSTCPPDEGQTTLEPGRPAPRG